ncbi:hypothetical protein PR003_g16561 [Phytophthora rubi]|uniref:Integrase catalytic domain-containing protein n=1 Tax=Phytophthora rubi TaxID=129364 RepID=A0A6A3LMQ5_9STRA|nr:hypothetical protein PR002_g13490 [Phytophthora rubi]KAE9325129.1 hypothetical protein PR003_g16561 [Phytophthora rubi]
MGLLHNHLNHASMDTIKQMMKTMTHRRNPLRATQLLQKISADICTINEVAADKSTMFMLVMDEYSRCTWVYPLQHEGGACQHIRQLKLKLGKQVKKYNVLIFHADGGGEFVSNELNVV